MKRSDAIETIKINSKLSDREIENVMELVELAIGMLPPARWVPNPDYPEFGLSTKISNTWEPED